VQNTEQLSFLVKIFKSVQT